MIIDDDEKMNSRIMRSKFVHKKGTATRTSQFSSAHFAFITAHSE